MANSSKQIDIKREGATSQHPIESLRSQIDRLFEDFDRNLFSSHWLTASPFERLKDKKRVVLPAVDVADEGGNYRVTAELPGMSEKDIEVTKHGDLLTIKGEKRDEKEKKGKGYYLAERHFGSFERTMRLPGTIDEAKIDAKYTNGVLTVTLPKSTEVASKKQKIEIKKA
jgi:HSP20 family protein